MSHLPEAPLRIEVFNYKTPASDPSHYLFPRVWLQFFAALRGLCEAATYAIGGVAVTGQTAAIPLAPVPVRNLVPNTPVTYLYPAGRYRVSSLARITTAASTSSAIQVDISWTYGGLPQGHEGVVWTSNDPALPISENFLILIDADTQIRYDIGYTSVGATALVYAADIVLEKLAD